MQALVAKIQNILDIRSEKITVTDNIITVTIPQKYNNSNWYKVMLRRNGINFTFSKTEDYFIYTIQAN